ncbi:fatty acid--CoA ligase [Solirhodobacter olei]|uniref:fatty acid--CoA ligase n=1 Tax=Solirhodobacter olei TaxID=2493082 RepID=UPI000FD6F9E0|nr:fatty acid--CoA ligase [Solirhodobacter olei]
MSEVYDYPLLVKQLLHSTLQNRAAEEIIYPGVMRYSYRDWYARLQRAANAYAALGLGPGSVIAVMDWDSHRYFESFFAVPMMGAVLHTVNVRLSPDQIVYTINHAEDDAILVHRDFLPLLAQVRDRITRPVKLILLQDAPGDLPEGFDGEYEALLAAASDQYAFPDFDERTRATLFYTTGTTGNPKGVTFTHRQIVLHTLAGASGGLMRRRDVYMPITPLFHVHAWGMPYIATLFGVRQVYPGRYEPARLLRLVDEHRVTFTHCVPTILSMLLAAPEVDEVDLTGWRVIIGGSALPEGLAAAAAARGVDVMSGYGMSETCPLLTTSDTAAMEAGATIGQRTATGIAAPMVELRVVDGEMRDMPPGRTSPGEVVVRAPWLTMGYLKDAEKTADLWRGGYLHTGDVGYLDADGTLHITDRIKDVIKSGGEWISSLDLENIASVVPGVAEVAAIGLPDPKWGERPCLVVALTPGARIETVEAGLRAAVEEAIRGGHLSKWAAPDRVEVVDALPKTSVGKLDKKEMRARLSGPRKAAG